MSAKAFIRSSVLEPIQKLLKNYTTLLLFFAGLAGIGLGIFLDSDEVLSRTILNASTAILGAGVFAAIMKSAQFTEVFQRHIFDVYYAPGERFTLDQLKIKWNGLTEAMLSSTIPRSHRDATETIRKQFFSSELEYHFEDFKVKYTLHLGQDFQTLTVTNRITTKVVLSPNHPDPLLKQTLTAPGTVSLKSVLIDGIPINLSDNKYFRQSSDSPDSWEFLLPLKDRASKKNADGDKYLKLERTYEYTQNISDEPFIVATVNRYVKGLIVRARINTEKGKIYFKNTGQAGARRPDPVTDGEGYQCWELADESSLLLPGQGYIIIVTASRAETTS